MTEIQTNYQKLYLMLKKAYQKQEDLTFLKDWLTDDIGQFLFTQYIERNLNKGKSSEAPTFKYLADPADEQITESLSFKRVSDDERPPALVAIYQLNAKTNYCIAFVIDWMDEYEFTPHTKAQGVYHIKRMGQPIKQYALRPFHKVIPDYKDVRYLYLLHGYDFYVAYVLLKQLMTLDQNHPHLAEAINDDEINLLLHLTTQTALNGTQIHGYDELNHASESVNDFFSYLYHQLANETKQEDEQNHTNYLVEKYIQQPQSQTTYLLGTNSPHPLSAFGFKPVVVSTRNEDETLAFIKALVVLFQEQVLPTPLQFHIPKLQLQFRGLGRERVPYLYGEQTLIVDTNHLDTFFEGYAKALNTQYNSEPLVETVELKQAIQQIRTTAHREMSSVDIFAKAVSHYLINQGVIPGQHHHVEEPLNTLLEDYLNITPIALSKYYQSLHAKGLDQFIPEPNDSSQEIVEDRHSHETIIDNQPSSDTLTDIYQSLSLKDRRIHLAINTYLEQLALADIESLLIQTDEAYTEDEPLSDYHFGFTVTHADTNPKISACHIITNSSATDDDYVVSVGPSVTKERAFFEVFYTEGIINQLPIDELTVKAQIALQKE